MSRADSAATITSDDSEAPYEDARIAAFCDPAGPEIFHSISHRHEIWRSDPFDVEVIHAEARAVFERLLHRATTPPGVSAGRILLLLGESGSGKTHLMRVFRNTVHGRRLGYFGYLQMTSATRNYGKYVLSNLIDSLDQPYFESETDASGLMCLSNMLVEAPSAIVNEERTRLREQDFSDVELGSFIGDLADQIREDERYQNLDVGLVQALLYLQREEPRIKARVLSYLRCEGLSDHDRTILGGIVPRDPDEADRTVEMLGRLMWHLQSASLVVCVDQLEDMYNLDEAEERFRRAMRMVCSLADRVPSSVFVISCLEDYYRQLQARLPRPVIDRIEKDPRPVRLESRRSAEEIEQLIARRLQYLYEESGASLDERDSTYPIPRTSLAQLTNLRTRDVLDWCRDYRENCIRSGGLLEITAASIHPNWQRPPAEVRPEGLNQNVTDLEQLWNDYRASTQPPPTNDRELVELLGWAVERCGDEIEGDCRIIAHPDGVFLDVQVEAPAGASAQVLQVGLCNKAPQGGHLGKQVQALEERAGEHKPVVVRSTDFPSSPKAQVVMQIGKLLARGGRRVVVEDSDWRSMAAMRSFRSNQESQGAFGEWLRSEKPLSRLKSLRELLALDALKPVRSHTEGPAAPEAQDGNGAVTSLVSSEGPPPLGKGARGRAGIFVGETRSRLPAHVMLEPAELRTHAAFLGGSGSGKTTAALNILEQLLVSGVPAILLDRKGDLCGYATDEFWGRHISDASKADRRDRLRESLDARVYTPGHPEGNPLSIPLVPEGLQELPSFERDQTANYAASALAGMMGLKQSQTDRSRIAILGQAIRLLAELTPEGHVTLDDLIELVGEHDPKLIAAVGRLDPKNFNKLTECLETLRLTRGNLLSADGPRLDVDALLGLDRDSVPGRTRLSIISTKFLGDNAGIEFWVAQFLMAVSRWASRHPGEGLQAVVFVDEADIYLPAQRQPATKGPMEDLLKRARSAGIGMLLATQSPGDFDYKCRDTIRTWFVGRIKERTAIEKMKPMLSDCRDDLAARFPGQTAGQFYLIQDGAASAVLSERSLLETKQLSEREILEVAAQSRRVR